MDDPKLTWELDVKAMDVLIINMYLLCKIIGLILASSTSILFLLELVISHATFLPEFLNEFICATHIGHALTFAHYEVNFN